MALQALSDNPEKTLSVWQVIKMHKTLVKTALTQLSKLKRRNCTRFQLISPPNEKRIGKQKNIMYTVNREKETFNCLEIIIIIIH